jgi:hypothetical protein
MPSSIHRWVHDHERGSVYFAVLAQNWPQASVVKLHSDSRAANMELLADAFDSALEAKLRCDIVAGKITWQAALNFQKLSRQFREASGAEMNQECDLHFRPSDNFEIGQQFFDTIAALDGDENVLTHVFLRGLAVARAGDVPIRSAGFSCAAIVKSMKNFIPEYCDRIKLQQRSV